MTFRTSPIRRALTAAVALICCQASFMEPVVAKDKGAAPGPKVLWSEPNMEINSPGFTPTGKRILFIRKAHEPDGAEGEAYAESEINALGEKAKADPRWADPEVMCVSLADTAVEKIDYGWEPKGTSDGTKIFYIHQKLPISGHRILAETQEGNELGVYNTGTKTHSIVATPDSGYFSNPTISPAGERVALGVCTATNGAYGGQVGIAIFDVQSGLVTKVLPETKHNELFDLVRSMFWVRNELFAIRETPLKPGMYRSEAYKVELLNVTADLKPIYESAKTDMSIDFKAFANPDGTITVIDEKRAIIDKAGVVIAKDLPIDPNELSPSKTIGIRREKDRIEVVRLGTNKVIYKLSNAEPPPGCMPPQLTFAPDSSNLAVVVDKAKALKGSTVFDRSELLLIDLVR